MFESLKEKGNNLNDKHILLRKSINDQFSIKEDTSVKIRKFYEVGEYRRLVLEYCKKYKENIAIQYKEYEKVHSRAMEGWENTKQLTATDCKHMQKLYQIALESRIAVINSAFDKHGQKGSRTKSFLKEITNEVEQFSKIVDNLRKIQREILKNPIYETQRQCLLRLKEYESTWQQMRAFQNKVETDKEPHQTDRTYLGPILKWLEKVGQELYEAKEKMDDISLQVQRPKEGSTSPAEISQQQSEVLKACEASLQKAQTILNLLTKFYENQKNDKQQYTSENKQHQLLSLENQLNAFCPTRDLNANKKWTAQELQKRLEIML